MTRARIDLDGLVRAVRHPAAGAIATFVGTTRNRNAGRRVVHLEYEAFSTLAVREMRRLGAEARGRWRLEGVAIVHRVGTVEIGEASVAIVVSAGHRAEAFAACRWLIDRLKRDVPIWKREHYRGGSVWVGHQLGPEHGRRASRVGRR